MQFLPILQPQNALQLPLYLNLNYELACLVHSGIKFHHQWQAPLQIPTFLSFWGGELPFIVPILLNMTGDL